MDRRILGFGAVLGLMILLFLVSENRHDPSVSAHPNEHIHVPSEPEVPIAEAESEKSGAWDRRVDYSDEFEQLRAEILALRHHNEEIEAQLVELKLEAPEIESTEMEHSTQIAEDQPEDLERFREELMLQLEAESVDEAWAQDMIDKIGAGMQHEELTSIKMSDADCRESLCRLEFWLDGTLSREESLQRLSILRPWDEASFVTADSSGMLQIFVSRREFSRDPESADLAPQG